MTVELISLQFFDSFLNVIVLSNDVCFIRNCFSLKILYIDLVKIEAIRASLNVQWC